jgi:hypothetical protein
VDTTPITIRLEQINGESFIASVAILPTAFGVKDHAFVVRPQGFFGLEFRFHIEDILSAAERISELIKPLSPEATAESLSCGCLVCKERRE